MKIFLEIIAAIFIIAGTIIGGYLFIEKRYALKEQLKTVQIRLDIKINSDYIQQIQNRIWTLEDRVSNKPDDITAKEELRKLREQKNQYESELYTLKQAIHNTTN